MIPTVDERLASVVRALTDVVVPSLPPEAGLALEQIQLSIGHIQIIRAQLDAAPAFEREELSDAIAVGEALKHLSGGDETRAAVGVLDDKTSAAAAAEGLSEVRAARGAIHDAVTTLIGAVSRDGDDPSRAALRSVIISQERARALKDRRWFAPFGFDSLAA